LDFTGNSDEYLAGDGTWQTGGPGGLDCRWEDVNSLTVTNETDLRTGFSTQDGCYRGKVVIGEEVAKNGKLESHNLYDRDSVSTAIWAESRQIDGQTTDNYATGIFGRAQGLQTGTELSMIFVGVEGIGGVSQPGRFNIGVRGTGQSDSEATLNFGGYFQATGPGSNNIGVYCEATDTSGLAAYFAGPTASGTPIALTSDASVKTNIESISEASQILSQLQPRSYNYIPIESRPGLFDESLQYGFIAQEMQEVLPELVKDVSLPALLDSSGVIEGTELELLGIQYTELIPILVAGFQEQNAEMTAVMEENQSLQAQVAEQANQIQALQEQMSNVMTSLQASQSKMNNCCGTPQEKKQSESGMIELEQNFPNPFNDVTTINYSTSYPAQIRLDISDSQGRVLEVLVNQRQDAGEYRVQWDASEFAPGTYYYSLYADTELLTKKMIKK
jgi:hypothetical protein